MTPPVPPNATASVGRSDALAIRELHDTHASSLYRWALRRFPDAREAEELVQDALVLAWRKYDQFDPTRGTERSWLFGIVRNEAASRHRRNSRRLSLVSTDEPIDDPTTDEIDELESIVVTEALNALSADHRNVLIAAHFNGHRIREIAVDFGLPEGTVKSRLYYALRSLRTELEERGILR